MDTKNKKNFIVAVFIKDSRYNKVKVKKFKYTLY